MLLTYILTAVGLIIYLVLTWLLGGWLKLTGGELWFLRIALAVIGFALAGLIIYMRWRKVKTAEAALGTSPLADDVQFIVREANTRLRASRGIHKGGKSIAELPLVLVIGESGSTKTTVVTQSGVTPELLSGQSSQDGTIPPTNACNIWLGAGTIFVEAGGPVLNDEPAWARLTQMLRPHRWTNWLGRGSQSARAVVICVDATTLAGSDSGSAATAAARRFQTRLGEVAHRWATRLPVYVLFTKSDQVPYFADYVRNFAAADVEAVFGATLPLAQAQVGNYNDFQGRQLMESYEALFLSLAEKRLVQLRLENDASKLPNIYEFPREFRKIRDNVVRLLLDVGRPSQLRASPFLRGFFFIGVRPIVADAMPAAPAPVHASGHDAGATRIFSGGPAAFAQQAMAARSAGTRRVPQWVFVKQFFTDVLLADSAARSASGSDTRASLIRRLLLITASTALAIWIIGATVSWSNNRELIGRANQASHALASVAVAPGRPLPEEAVRNLEELRRAAEEVTRYERDGAPWSFRWGLYPGHRLYDNVRTAYCRDLGNTMLGPVRASMGASLASLRSPAAAGDEYEPSYRTLKAYLMTTSNPDKTEPQFLTDVLTARWVADQRAESQAAAARQQFAFYSAEHAGGMCSAPADSDAVERARGHLWSFPIAERIYRSILTNVSKGGQPIGFVDPAGAVVDAYKVPWAFSRDGWPRVRKAIREESRGLSQEGWVLGPDRASSAPMPSKQELEQKLNEKYQADFIHQWRSFIDGGYVVRYASLPDAARKLGSMTSPTSGLLKLFCTVARNTNIDSPDVVKEFRGIQQLQVPDTCESAPIAGAAAPYMQALSGLQLRVEALSTKPDDLPLADQVNTVALDARQAAKTAVQANNLQPKPEKLLVDPIIMVNELVARTGPDAANGKGAEFCREAGVVFRRFPFEPAAHEDVRVEDLNAVLQPGAGKLAKFYQDSLQDILVFNGQSYSPKPGAKIKATAGFVNFMNRATALSKMMYAANPTRPGFTYNVQGRPAPNVESYTLTINGRNLNGSGRGGESQDFAWTGGVDTVTLTPKNPSGPSLTRVGPWATLHVTAEANRTSENGAVFEYDVKTAAQFGKQTARSGAEATVKLRVTGPGGAPLPSYFPRCEPRVAQP